MIRRFSSCHAIIVPQYHHFHFAPKPLSRLPLLRYFSTELVLKQNLESVERQLSILKETEEKCRVAAAAAATTSYASKNNNNNNNKKPPSSDPNVRTIRSRQPHPEDAATRLFKSLVQEWVDSGTFEDPDHEVLQGDAALMCRWLVASAELLIGEDHVDWVCETLYKLHSDDIETATPNPLSLLTADHIELVKKTVCAFEKWRIRETPQCYGLVPLLAFLTRNVKHLRPEDIGECVSSIAVVFRRRNKEEKHFRIPEVLDRQVALLVSASAEHFLVAGGGRGHSGMQSWIKIVTELLRVGIKRFPTALRVVVESVFFFPAAATQQHRMMMMSVVVYQQRMQRDPGLTQRLVDALEKYSGVGNERAVADALVGGWLFPVLLAQVPSWPLTEIAMLSSLCLHCLGGGAQRAEEQQKQQHYFSLCGLLTLCLRTSYVAFHDIVELHPTLGNVETAFCANKFLHHLSKAPQDDVIAIAAAGMPTRQLDVPAQKILSRFPHLIK